MSAMAYVLLFSKVTKEKSAKPSSIHKAPRFSLQVLMALPGCGIASLEMFCRSSKVTQMKYSVVNSIMKEKSSSLAAKTIIVISGKMNSCEK